MVTTTPRLDLWHAPECPHSMRARLALREKGLDYHSHEVSLRDVGDEVRRRNPQGQVPVLDHDGCSIYEAQIIAEYLDEQFQFRPLFPTRPAMRARARMLIDWCDNDLVGPVSDLETAWAKGQGRRPIVNPSLADAVGDVHDVLNALARVVDPDPYLLSSDKEPFGIADLFFAPFVTGLDQLGVRRDDVPPTVARWIDRLRDRASIAAEADLRLGAVAAVA